MKSQAFIYNSSLLLMLFFLMSNTNITQSQPIAIDKQYFIQIDAFLKKNVSKHKVNYAAIANDPSDLLEILKITDNAALKGLDTATQKAFYINAYNLSVIKSIVLAYPIASVQEVEGFFEEQQHKIAGKYLTLNELEKNILIQQYKDPRLHFVLVCGAVGCPPLADFAYLPKKVEAQIQKQTTIALNDPSFIKKNPQKKSIQINKIFDWYKKDFLAQNSKNIIDYINQFAQKKIPNTHKISYYDYDWTLNDTNLGVEILPNNATRYIASAILRKKQMELKIFTNLYTQKTGFPNIDNTRSTFLTTFFQYLYGIHPRINLGFDVKLRSVRNGLASDTPFQVFNLEQSQVARWGLTALGPKIRFAPISKLPNFSIQSTLYFPIGKDLAGNNERPYIDWQGLSFFNQFFNDFTLGSHFSLFLEMDLLLENISTDGDQAIFFSSPFKSIVSYFPTPKSTLYLSGEVAPTWSGSPPKNYYLQAGLGTKYQFSRYVELELLYTRFTNRYLSKEANGQATTLNLGLRVTY